MGGRIRRARRLFLPMTSPLTSGDHFEGMSLPDWGAGLGGGALEAAAAGHLRCGRR